MDISAIPIPLVSIVLFCRNSAATIREAINSVLSSSYPHIELVVQDGLSTDGTLDILYEYGDRINLISEADEGPSDAFRRALSRCTGEIIGCCLSDEELPPDAIAEAVAYLRDHPEQGAVIGNAIIRNTAGTTEIVGREFDLLDYLFGRDTPYFCACFVSRRALDEIGFFTEHVFYNAFEFEIWCRLATEHRIGYLARPFAKYATGNEQLGNAPKAIVSHLEARIATIQRLFSAKGFFGTNPRLRDRVILAQYRMFHARAVSYGLTALAATLESRLVTLSTTDEAAFTNAWFADQRARRIWLGFGNMVPPEIKRWILTKGLHRIIRSPFFFVTKLLQPRSAPTDSASGSTELHVELALRHDLAMLYASRGQIDEAMDQWRQAEALGDATIDSLACQVAQRSSFTAAQIQKLQVGWAQRHANQPLIKPQKRWKPESQAAFRVGYHCAWWDSTTARHQLLNFVAQHERERVLPFCYSPIPVPQDIAQHFEAVRVTGKLSDRDFVAQSRADHLDIFVEATGFSPEHRFAAMAQRCAPVQISYLNHHATTGVPNIDYVLVDSFLAQGEDRSYFTESLYPLPRCFFCFDFRSEDIPYATEPPSKTRGVVTLGWFGAASKINLRLIQLWAAVLAAIPNSRLFLRSRDLTSEDNRRFLIRRFARFGIDAARLRVMPGTDHATILQDYAEVDISLDTWPYCGGNTIAESFWQGVPVVTLLGDRLSARYGASLVRAHGCPELIAESQRDYIRIVADLARDPARLASYRSTLRESISAGGFNDSKRFAENVENAYFDMMSRLE